MEGGWGEKRWDFPLLLLLKDVECPKIVMVKLKIFTAALLLVSWGRCWGQNDAGVDLLTV